MEIDRKKKIVACSFLSNIGSSSHLFVAVLLHSNETPFQKTKATIKSHLHIYRYDPGSKALVLFKESEQFVFDRELHSLTPMCSQADLDSVDAGSSALDHFNKKRKNKDVHQTLLLRGEDITALNVKIEDNRASIQVFLSSLQLPCPTRDETNVNILRRSILPVISTGSNTSLIATLEGDVYLLRVSGDPNVSSTSLKFLTKDPVFSRPTGIYTITDNVFIIAPSHGQHGRLLRLSKDKESLVQIPSDSSCLNKWTSIADVAVVSSLAGQTEIVAISPFEQDSLRVLRREATFDQLITADLGYNNIANGCWVLNISSESFSQRSLVFLFLLSFSSATRALVLQCNSNRLLSSSSESNGEESERTDEDSTFLEDISEWVELETEGPTIYSSLMEVLPKTSGSHRQVVLQVSRNSIRAIETLHILNRLSKDSTDQEASSSSSQSSPSLLRFHTNLHNSSITAVFSLSYHLVVAMTDLSGENTIILYTMVFDEEGNVLELLERSRRTWPSEITSLLIENVSLSGSSSSNRKFILFVGTYDADVSILSLDFGEHLQTLHHLDIKTLMKDSQDQEHDIETNIPNSMALCPLAQRLDDWNEAEGPPIASLSVPESENTIQVLAIGLRNGKVLFLSFHGGSPSSSSSSSSSLDHEERSATSLGTQSQIHLKKIDSFSIGGQPVKIVSTTLPPSYNRNNHDGTKRPRSSKALLILSNSSWLLTEIFSQRTPSETSTVKHRLNMQSLTFDDPIRFAAPLNQNSLPSFSDLTRPDRNRISSSILILTSTSLSVSQLLKQTNLTKATLPILPRLTPARLDRSNSTQSIPMEDEHFGTVPDEKDNTSLSVSSSSLSLSSSASSMAAKKKAPRMLKIEFLKRQRLLAILSEKSVRFIDTVEYRVVHELIPETLPFPTFIEPENLFRLFHVRDISHDPGIPAAIIFNDHILLAIAMIAPEGHSSCVQLYWLQFRSNSTVESKCLCTIDFKECIVSSVHVVPHAAGWNLLIGSKMLVRKQKSRVCVFEISMTEKACIMEKKSKRKTLSTVMTISHSDNMVLMGTHDESVGLYELSQNALHFVNGFVFSFSSFLFLDLILFFFFHRDWKRRAIVDCMITPNRLIGLDAYGCVCTFKRSSVEKTKGFSFSLFRFYLGPLLTLISPSSFRPFLLKKLNISRH